MLSTATVAEVLGERTRVVAALADVQANARQACDPALLALCERRVGQLLGVEAPSLVDDSAAIAASLERAALIFVDQWVVDVASVTDEMVASLSVELGDGQRDDDRLMDFVHGLLVVEQRLRLAIAWQRLGLAS